MCPLIVENVSSVGLGEIEPCPGEHLIFCWSWFEICPTPVSGPCVGCQRSFVEP